MRIIDGQYDHNELVAVMHLNDKFPKSEFEYVGDNYKFWDAEDSLGNLFEIKTRSYEMASRGYDDCLYEQFKNNKLNCTQ